MFSRLLWIMLSSPFENMKITQRIATVYSIQTTLLFRCVGVERQTWGCGLSSLLESLPLHSEGEFHIFRMQAQRPAFISCPSRDGQHGRRRLLQSRGIEYLGFDGDSIPSPQDFSRLSLRFVLGMGGTAFCSSKSDSKHPLYVLMTCVRPRHATVSFGHYLMH